jgi:hypothetical protein
MNESCPPLTMQTPWERGRLARAAPERAIPSMTKQYHDRLFFHQDTPNPKYHPAPFGGMR